VEQPWLKTNWFLFLPTMEERLHEVAFRRGKTNPTGTRRSNNQRKIASAFFPNEKPRRKSIRMIPPLNLAQPGIREKPHQTPLRPMCA